MKLERYVATRFKTDFAAVSHQRKGVGFAATAFELVLVVFVGFLTQKKR